MIWIVLVAAVLIVGAVVVLVSNRRVDDGVDSFRRQIDALSSDARRPIVGRVNEVQERRDEGDERRSGDERKGGGSGPGPDVADGTDGGDRGT